MAAMRTLLFAAIALLAPMGARADDTAEAEIKAALTQWMADFNQGKAD